MMQRIYPKILLRKYFKKVYKSTTKLLFTSYRIFLFISLHKSRPSQQSDC